MESKNKFFLESYKLEIIKFGKFTLKIGIESPFYVDLRPLASDPKILKKLAEHLLEILPKDTKLDLICGVPYAALPMATVMSLLSGIPLIMKRKEAKGYGTKKLIEGIYKQGQSCLLVEDVITSGKSLLETIAEVEKEGLKVSDIVVVLDRQQGGKELLEQKGYRVHTLFTITEVMKILHEAGEIDNEQVAKIHDFLAGKQVKFKEEKRLSYEQKLEVTKHPTAKKLLQTAINKKSNLIVSADVVTTSELLNLAEKVGQQIVALKTHIDIIKDFDHDKTILPLVDLARKHNFLLMEDRKFADIGSTQELQFSKGVYQISKWADMVTSHLIAGKKSLECFKNVGVIAILGMSSQGTLTDAHYQEEGLKIVEEQPNIMGCVAQRKINKEMLLFTPGVSLEQSGDDKGQQYNTPDHVFHTLHTDFIIVGRGVYQAEDAEKSSKNYREIGWEAYEKSLK
jgi:orotidine 5'-phosphate decarboxylase